MNAAICFLVRGCVQRGRVKTACTGDAFVKFRTYVENSASNRNPEIIEAFDKACLEPVPDGLFDKEMNERIAFITKPGKEPICGAFRISGNRFLTAAHCLEARQPHSLRVHLIGSLSVAHQVTAIAPKARVNGWGDDLRLFSADYATDGTPDDAASWIGAIEPISELELVGYFSFHKYLPLRIASAGNEMPARDWSAGLRKTRTDEGAYSHCRILDVSVSLGSENGQGCIIHGCQSFHKFSGSPVLAKGADGSFKLVGVQVAGTAGNDGGKCSRPFVHGATDDSGNVDRNDYYGRGGAIAAGVKLNVIESLLSSF